MNLVATNMSACTQSRTHTRNLPHINTHVHRSTHTHTHTHNHAYSTTTCTYTHLHARMYDRTPPKHTHIRAYKHTRIHNHVNKAHTHVRTHTYAYTQICAHTHTRRYFPVIGSQMTPHYHCSSTSEWVPDILERGGNCMYDQRL